MTEEEEEQPADVAEKLPPVDTAKEGDGVEDGRETSSGCLIYYLKVIFSLFLWPSRPKYRCILLVNSDKVKTRHTNFLVNSATRIFSKCLR